jgi:RNA polymerase sigma factor for flagellar operon FliA
MAIIGSTQRPLSESDEEFRAHLAPGVAEEDRLVREHMPLVGHIVRETLARVPSHVSRDDLTSAGLVALVQVVRAFDPSRGVPLGRYAAQRIRGAVLDELRGLDWASRSVRRRERELESVRATLAMTHGRTATSTEVAEAAGLSAAEVAAHSNDVARGTVLSLQGITSGGLEELLPTQLPGPGEQLLVRERLTYLRQAIDLLPERLGLVISGYYLDERPMAELAAELGVTESRVSQIRAEAMTLLTGAMHRALPDEPVALEAPARAVSHRREVYYAAVVEHGGRSNKLSSPAVA